MPVKKTAVKKKPIKKTVRKQKGGNSLLDGIEKKFQNSKFDDIMRLGNLFGLKKHGSGKQKGGNFLSSLNFEGKRKEPKPSMMSKLANNITLPEMLTIGEIIKKNL